MKRAILDAIKNKDYNLVIQKLADYQKATRGTTGYEAFEKLSRDTQLDAKETIIVYSDIRTLQEFRNQLSYIINCIGEHTAKFGVHRSNDREKLDTVEAATHRLLATFSMLFDETSEPQNTSFDIEVKAILNSIESLCIDQQLIQAPSKFSQTFTEEEKPKKVAKLKSFESYCTNSPGIEIESHSEFSKTFKEEELDLAVYKEKKTTQPKTPFKEKVRNLAPYSWNEETTESNSLPPYSHY